MKRTAVLQRIAQTIKAETYLEIGVRNPDDNFMHVANHICGAGVSIGVDPAPRRDRVFSAEPGDESAIMSATSDDFFERLDKATKGRRRLYASSDAGKVKVPKLFDLIFIDGDHRREQAARDLANACAHLTPKGVVVMHDVCPASPDEALPEKPKNGRPWCGEVWKVVAAITSVGDAWNTCGLTCGVLVTDHGLAAIWRTGKDPIECGDILKASDPEPGLNAWIQRYNLEGRDHEADLYNVLAALEAREEA